MTKVKAHSKLEEIVEALHARFGGRMVDTTMVIGGKTQKVRRGEGGMFDIDTCRGLVMNAITTNLEDLLTKALPAGFAPKAKEEKPKVEPEDPADTEAAMEEIEKELNAA